MNSVTLLSTLRSWGIGAVREFHQIHPGVYGLTTEGGDRFVLKAVGPTDPDMVERLEFHEEVLTHLQCAGVPVAVPVRDRDGRIAVVSGSQGWVLLPRLPNRPDNWDSLDSAGEDRLMHNWGAAIARMHVALANFPEERLLGRTWHNSLERQVPDECIPAVACHLTADRRGEFERMAGSVAEDLTRRLPGLPEQLIHRDCHPGNVLVDGTRVTGFVDCDHFSTGPRILDIAYFAVQLVKWKVGDPKHTRIWLRWLPLLLRGYESQSALLPTEREGVCPVMLAIPLLFAGHFYRRGESDHAEVELDAFAWLYLHRQDISESLGS